MSNYTQAEARKEINEIAKENGLVFKRQNSTINGVQAYRFTSRETGLNIIENCTFWSAYADCMSGNVSDNKQ